jgi:hypothetical protein
MAHNREKPYGKISIVTLKAEEFGGEFDRRSAAYIGALWLAGFWAMVTNSSQALYRKTFLKWKYLSQLETFHNHRIAMCRK